MSDILLNKFQLHWIIKQIFFIDENHWYYKLYLTKNTYGNGTVIKTFLSSKCSFCSSYSILTSQPLLVSEGQQLTSSEKQIHKIEYINIKVLGY